MSMLAQAARGFKNIWTHGDEEDYAHDEHSAQDTPDDSSYLTDKYSDKYSTSSSYSTGSGYSGGHSGSSGGSAGGKRLRSVPIPLRAREKNIYTLRPKSQDEAAIAADYLKAGSAVVINLETVERYNAIRIIDFMSGVCYGLEGQGHAMKLGDTIFLFTPAEFEISSDEIDYGENRDFFFKDVEPVVMNAAASSPAMSDAAAPSGVPSYGSAYQSGSGYQSSERRSWER